MIYIGIVTYHSLADLPACLASIQAQTHPDWHVTIADNASAEDVGAWVRAQAMPLTFIQNTDNLGYGRAHNQIIARLPLTPDDFYLTLNPDVVLAPDYLATLSAGLREHGAGWGVGRLRLPDITPPRLYSIGHALLGNGYAFNIGYDLPDGPPFETSREVFGAPGAAALYSGVLLAELQPLFDEHLFLYAEDVDADWRARRRGWRCWYIADALATHRGSQPGPDLQDHALANRFLVTLKNACWRDLITHLLPYIGLHSLLRLALTPRRGYRILRQVLRLAWPMRQQRGPTLISCADLREWYRWAAQQPAHLPRTYRQRWRAFIAKHREMDES